MFLKDLNNTPKGNNIPQFATNEVWDRSMRWQYEIILALMSSISTPDCIVNSGIPSGGGSFL